jgi:3-methyl-2-oxobutanoate hydroxymethyltransferase
MKKISINKIIQKKNKIPITCLTAYSVNIAKIANKYCDIILVGDSLGMVLYGMKSTREVKLETMINHARAVKKAANRSLVVFDMPYKTYRNRNIAYKNAKDVLKITKCDAVKLEGGKEIKNTINFLIKKGIPVMGHIGLLPQTAKKFEVKGKKKLEKKKFLNDANEISKAGVFAIIIECVVAKLSKKITESVKVPTIGIGASKFCDGQILVSDDLLGLSDFYPKFVKRYANLNKIIERSVKKYTKDVKSKMFPLYKNTYK